MLIFDREGGQIPLHYGAIELTRGIKLESVHHLEAGIACPDGSIGFIDRLLNAYLKKFKRTHRGKQGAVLSMLLANLEYAHRHSKGVLYSRDTNGAKDARIIKDLVFFLEENDLIVSIKQPPNKSGCTSYVLALPELIKELGLARAKITKSKNHKPILLRDKNKEPMKIDRLKNHTPNKYNCLVSPVELHNNLWSRNKATLKKLPIIPYLHRVFNRTIDLGGRFYGTYQNIPSADRLFILINGKPTVELDYKSIHIAILYSWVGKVFVGDPYAIEGYDRQLVKDVILRLVNSKSRSAVEGVITRSSKERQKYIVKNYKISMAEYKNKSNFHRKATAPNKPKCLDSHIENIPTGFDAKLFINKLLECHSAISHLLGEKDVGLELQNDDSALIGALLNDLCNRKAPIPVLPVHDSLICKESDSKDVIIAMEYHFRKKFNADIEVKKTKKPAPLVRKSTDNETTPVQPPLALVQRGLEP